MCFFHTSKKSAAKFVITIQLYVIIFYFWKWGVCNHIPHIRRISFNIVDSRLPGNEMRARGANGFLQMQLSPPNGAFFCLERRFFALKRPFFSSNRIRGDILKKAIKPEMTS